MMLLKIHVARPALSRRGLGPRLAYEVRGVFGPLGRDAPTKLRLVPVVLPFRVSRFFTFQDWQTQ